MKTLKSILMIAVLLMGIQASAQTDKATTAKLVNAQNFVFNATTAMPMANAEINAILSQMPGGQAGGIIHQGISYRLRKIAYRRISLILEGPTLQA